MLISTTHSVAFLFQFLVVFFSIVSCNERPRLSLSTSDNMQRLEREMRGLGRRRRASAPPPESYTERGGTILPPLCSQKLSPNFSRFFSAHFWTFWLNPLYRSRPLSPPCCQIGDLGTSNFLIGDLQRWYVLK